MKAEPDFIFPCHRCQEPIAFANGRPDQTHTCYEQIED